MKRIAAFVFVFGLIPMTPVLAQERGAEERAAESPSRSEHGTLELWKWANFLVLAGLLGSPMPHSPPHVESCSPISRSALPISSGPHSPTWSA